jgi:hypothetical protein
MRLTWVSGDMKPQQVQYGDRKTLTSEVITFTQDNMCSEFLSILLNIIYPCPSFYLLLRFCPYVLKWTDSTNLPSPAKDFGWHDPGYIHSAVMTGLKPSSNFSYRYGRF